jgi:hypothetical protein
VGKRYDQPEAGEWVLPVRRGYKLCCCSCGLVHRIDFRVRKRRVEFRAFLAPRSTAMVRRWRKAREEAEVKAMPTVKGYSRKAIGANIKAELKSGRAKSQKQAVAIALDIARKAAKKAGVPSKGPKKPKGKKSK